MRAKSKILSILMSLVLAAGLCPASAFAEGDIAVATSSALTTQAAAHTQDEAVAWARSMADNHVPCGECVALIQKYYGYLGVSVPNTNANTYANGDHIPPGWTVDNNPSLGAVYVEANYSPGHVSIVVGIDSAGTLTTVDSNVEGSAYGQYNAQYFPWPYLRARSTYSGVSGKYFVHPQWPTPAYNPEGYLDSAVGSDGTLYVKGWALDRDNTGAQLEVHVYVGGTGIDGERHVLKADKSRSDVNSALGLPGAHGFEATFSTNVRGSVPVYAHAVNVGGGNNSQLTQVITATILEPKKNAVSVAEGTYAIRTKMDSSKGLDVNQASEENTANVMLHSWNGGDNQKFSLKTAGDGSYYIVAKHSNKAVEVTNGLTASGANVAQYTQNQSVAQRWFFDKNSDGTYTIRQRNSGLVMDVSGAKTENDTNIQQHPAHGGDNQKFYLVPTDAAMWDVSALAQQQYTGSSVRPTPTVTAGGVPMKAGTDYAVSYTNNVDPGTATLTIKGKGGYTGSKSITFSIAAAQTESLYRLHNPATGEHLYTTSASEYRTLSRKGWEGEGAQCSMPAASSSIPKAGIYRLFNPRTGEHHYAMDDNEISVLTERQGWAMEGLMCYAPTTSANKKVPMYRLNNPARAPHTHLFTTDANEYNVLGSRGWQQEGIAWYGL